MASTMLVVLELDPQTIFIYWHSVGEALMLYTQKLCQSQTLYHFIYILVEHLLILNNNLAAIMFVYSGISTKWKDPDTWFLWK